MLDWGSRPSSSTPCAVSKREQVFELKAGAAHIGDLLHLDICELLDFRHYEVLSENRAPLVLLHTFH